MSWLLGYALIGAIVGFLAGLLGIGGGMTLVPVLSAMFAAQQLSADHTVHLALATAMASVVFTSSSSVFAHHRKGAVDWSIVRRMAPGMVAGSLLATLAAGWLSQRVLAIGFAVIVYGGATQMLLGRKPQPGRTVPGPVPLTLLGLVIGVICGLVSAGGAFLTVPLKNHENEIIGVLQLINAKDRETGEIVPVQTRAFRSLRGPADADVTPVLQQPEVYQHEVVYGRRLVLKVLRGIAEGVNAEVEIGRFLTEHASFVNVAPIAASPRHRTTYAPFR